MRLIRCREVEIAAPCPLRSLAQAPHRSVWSRGVLIVSGAILLERRARQFRLDRALGARRKLLDQHSRLQPCTARRSSRSLASMRRARQVTMVTLPIAPLPFGPAHRMQTLPPITSATSPRPRRDRRTTTMRGCMRRKRATAGPPQWLDGPKSLTGRPGERRPQRNFPDVTTGVATGVSSR